MTNEEWRARLKATEKLHPPTRPYQEPEPRFSSVKFMATNDDWNPRALREERKAR